ncbi:MAG: GIY-YIG nuclease family protein [Bacteroidota bacterium]|nr:GIY-YIG nuclease family protein [Bacteroidota bacterium]
MFFTLAGNSEYDESLYTGQTSNLKKKFQRHNKGSVKSTKRKIPYKLGYFEVYKTRAESMWREWELKTKFSTERKKKMIAEFDRSRIKIVLD